MDDNSVHTSVVIELGNQGDTEVQKMYQIDLNDVNSSKDYVIDQIFCGENVTVYALFEVEDEDVDVASEKRSDEEDVEDLTASSEPNNEVKYYRRKPGSKEEDPYKLEKVSKDDDEADVSFKEFSKKRSFYCLQKYLDDSSLEDGNTDMRVLYTKEAMMRSQKFDGKRLKTVKTRSTGMNTDLAFCPKLLDEVCQVIGASFSGVKKEEKGVGDGAVELSKFAPELSNSFASSSATSVNASRKSSVNFLLIPLVMTEEGLLKRFQKEDREPAKTKSETDNENDDEKFNGNVMAINVPTSAEEEELKIKDVTEKTCACRCANPDGKREDARKETEDELEEKNNLWKQSISEEIKSVHLKLNVIMEWLGTNGSEPSKLASNKSEDTLRKCAKTHLSNSFTKNQCEVSEKKGTFSGEPPCLVSCSPTENVARDPKSGTDELDYTSKNPTVNEPPPSNQNVKNNMCLSPVSTATREISAARSASVTSTTSTYNMFSLKNILDNGSNAILTKNDFEVFENYEKIKKRCQGTIGLSKSDSNFRLVTCADFKWGVARTQSLDLRQERGDAFGNKKLKSVLLKPENNLKVKANFVRNYSKLGNSLTNLTPNKCEMGDEVAVKERKSSKLSVLNVESTVVDKQELFNTLKREILEMEPVVKAQSKEDFCKQQKFPKNRLTLPQFLCKNDNLAVQYCDSTANESAMLTLEKVSCGTPYKSDKQSPRKGGEVRKKGVGDKSTPRKASESPQRAKTAENSLKRDFSSTRDAKNSSAKKTPVKPVRTEKRDSSVEPARQKQVYRAAKSVVKTGPDSKLHIDKLVKSTVKNHAETKSEKVNQEKPAEKNESVCLSRPPSQKRRRNLSTSSGNETKSKGLVSFTQKSSRSSTIETQKCSLESILQKEKTDRVLVFDKKLENVFVAKRVTEPNGQATKTMVEPESPVVVELFSKKPASFDEFSGGRETGFTSTSSSQKISSQEKIVESSKSANGSTMSDVDAQKAIVKSVWALTKVLLYGDGTKKFEILEASLTPPGFSLNNDNSNSNKSR